MQMAGFIFSYRPYVRRWW